MKSNLHVIDAEENTPLSSIEEIVAELRAGKMVVVVDDEDRENEGDLIMPAETATPQAINFMITHGRGLICVPILKKRAEQLNIDLMPRRNIGPTSCAFTISVDAKENGVTTGISASDRSTTIQMLADEKYKADAFQTPGHIFPLIAREEGVLARPGHTEASVDLARMAGFYPAGILCEILNEDGTMARLPDLRRFARLHNLKIASIADLIAYRQKLRQAA
ncbi:MAG: 3,4-dihydroxy-2-butanone-4-phosphate synthase [Dongiaceae bacterium]